MSERPIADLTRDLVADGVAWIHHGTVENIEQHADWGYLLTVRLQPSQRVVQARWLHPGGGDREGVYIPIASGAEVLVFLPEGDPNSAIAVFGLNSRPAKIPQGFGNDHIEMVHQGGTKVRLVDGATVHNVVLETLLPDLLSSLTELANAFKGLSIPTPETDDLLAKLPTDFRSASLETD